MVRVEELRSAAERRAANAEAQWLPAQRSLGAEELRNDPGGQVEEEVGAPPPSHRRRRRGGACRRGRVAVATTAAVLRRRRKLLPLGFLAVGIVAPACLVVLGEFRGPSSVGRKSMGGGGGGGDGEKKGGGGDAGYRKTSLAPFPTSSITRPMPRTLRRRRDDDDVVAMVHLCALLSSLLPLRLRAVFTVCSSRHLSV